jgi:hypothetical protein
MNTLHVCRTILGLWLPLLVLGCRTKGQDERHDAGLVDAADAARTPDTTDVDASAAGVSDGDAGAPAPTDAGSGITLGDIGTACQVNAECASGSCVDGVCCSSSMCGPCQSCGLPDTAGACAPLPPFVEDPRFACTAPHACDGLGHCLVSNGQRCASGTECISGSCADGVCCASACGEQCYSCALAGLEGTCSPLAGAPDPVASAPCTGTSICVATSSGAPACRGRDGLSCSADGDCASGHCRTYYLDGDGDGYGSKAHALYRCDATVNPPAGYVANATDCCDFDKAANPGVPKTSYFTTPDACGDFDYDCDGLIEKEAEKGTCYGVAAGATPDCGKDCDNYPNRFFSTTSVLYTQACR